VSENWRLTARIESEGLRHVFSRLRDHDVEADARKRLGGAVAVSSDGDNLFVYADSHEAVQEAEGVIRALLQERGLDADVEIHRWHELEQRWEDEDVPLPLTEAERQVEHERLEADDAAESQKAGRALWEVRLELPSHDETLALARQLEAEGLPVLQRWTYLLVGGANEDEARALAERLQEEAPEGTTVHVEASGEMVAQVKPANPFAVFGGLADV
jgi:hypothetical protein